MLYKTEHMLHAEKDYDGYVLPDKCFINSKTKIEDVFRFLDQLKQIYNTRKRLPHELYEVVKNLIENEKILKPRNADEAEWQTEMNNRIIFSFCHFLHHPPAEKPEFVFINARFQSTEFLWPLDPSKKGISKKKFIQLDKAQHEIVKVVNDFYLGSQ